MSGPSSIELSTSISDSLGIELFEVENKSFPDGEHKVRIRNEVQNKNIILVQSLYPLVDHHFMQFLLTTYKLTNSYLAIG